MVNAAYLTAREYVGVMEATASQERIVQKNHGWIRRQIKRLPF